MTADLDAVTFRRNDAIEKVDEALLARVAAVAVERDAWHNSETAAAMIDRLSILALKVFHMRAQTLRTDATRPELLSTGVIVRTPGTCSRTASPCSVKRIGPQRWCGEMPS